MRLRLPFIHKSRHKTLAHGSGQGAVRSQWWFHWQAPQRRSGPCARVSFGRTARRLAVARLVYKGQGLRRVIPIMLLMSLVACQADETQRVREQHPVVSAQTLTLHASKVPVYHITSGVVSSEHRVAIASRVSGYIRGLPVREGEQVKKGQLLVRVDRMDATQSLAQARANFSNAQSNLHRYSRLLAEHAVTRQEFDKVRLRFRITRSRVKQAKNQLRYTEIRSPINGIIVRKIMNTGDLASPNTPILMVEDSSQLLVETDVSAAAAGALQVGDTVDISIPALHLIRTGHIRQLVNAANPVSHQFHIKISLNSTQGIRPGMFAEVRFHTGIRHALLIPPVAVIHRLGLNGIYVVDPRGIVHYRQIRLGLSLAKRIEVVAGLHAGDRIAWNVEHSLRTDMRIRGIAMRVRKTASTDKK